MRDKFAPNSPFRALGDQLKSARIRQKKSLAEVSGAVEIDEPLLRRIEQGVERPNEEILLLLISHFNVSEDEATRLWELAGFDEAADIGGSDEPAHNKPVMMVMQMDPRIVYTDMVQVSVNNFGVVMNFLQTGGPGGQPLAIARVGMSQEHAKSVLELLQKSLAQAEAQRKPRHLPAPRASRQSGSPKTPRRNNPDKN